MSTCTHLAASALLGLTAVVAGGSAAQAGPQSVSVSSVAGVIFEDCHDHPISYAVAPPADANFWSIHLTVQGPDGTVADDFVSVSSASGATSGVVMTRLCGSTSGAISPRSRSVAGVGPNRRGLWKSTPIRFSESGPRVIGTFAPRRMRIPVFRNSAVRKSSTRVHRSWFPRHPQTPKGARSPDIACTTAREVPASKVTKSPVSAIRSAFCSLAIAT